jgi:hypothetical protein
LVTPGEYEWHTTSALGIKLQNGMPENVWLELARKAIAFYEGTRDAFVIAKFAVGDILNYGEGAFGERYAQAADATKKAMRMDMKTMMNTAWIAGSIALENRHELLSFSHHEAVAKLSSDDQKDFLDSAELNEWSVAELKKNIKAKYPGTPRGDGPQKAGLLKAVIDFGDEASVLLAIEKIAQYLQSEKCGILEMETARVKEFRGRILAAVEAFAVTADNGFFERMTGLVGRFLAENEEQNPVREWSEARKARWAPGLNEIAKAGRRGGMIGAAKPDKRAEASQTILE